MPKLLVIFLSLTIGSLVLSCGPRLSEEEAKTIISERYGGERVSTLILVYENNKNSTEDKKLIMGLQKLISDGYVEIDDTDYIKGQYYPYKPTSKGRPYINKLSFYYRFSEDNVWTFDGTVARKVLKEINEILIDKQNNIATVTFTLKLEPVEPIYSLVCVSSNCSYFGLSSINDEKMKVILKKWDKGWRMLGE